MKIIEVKEFSRAYLATAQKLLRLLLPEQASITEADFKALIASDNSHLFFLLVEDTVAGMATVGIYRSPSGSKAWIEDVVVDEAYRGKGYGRMLTQHAIDFAKAQKADLLMLTSSPKRIAANNLYQSIGFKRKETNLYRMMLIEQALHDGEGLYFGEAGQVKPVIINDLPNDCGAL